MEEVKTNKLSEIQTDKRCLCFVQLSRSLVTDALHKLLHPLGSVLRNRLRLPSPSRPSLRSHRLVHIKKQATSTSIGIARAVEEGRMIESKEEGRRERSGW